MRKMIINKNENGITLISLAVTIIVLLILAGVAISMLSGDNGLLRKVASAKEKTGIAQIEEEVALYSYNYTINNYRSLKQDTVNKMKEICTSTGISVDKLTIFYNRNTGTELILYRVEKVTNEEKDILEGKGVLALRGDVDLDGVLTENDRKLINSYNNSEIEFTKIQEEIGDLNNDTVIDTIDHTIIGVILDKGEYPGGYVK